MTFDRPIPELRRGLTGPEAREKHHRNDDQPMQHALARPNTVQLF